MLQLLAQDQQLKGLNDSGIEGLSPLNPGFSPDGKVSNAVFQLNNLISLAIGAITMVAGLAFLLYFLMGALGWLTAGGDKQKLDNSRDRITTALIGLVLVIAAYAITGVVGSIFGLDILNPRNMFCQIIGNPTKCQVANGIFTD